MTIFKKIAALMLATTIALSGASAYAEDEAPSAAGNETTIIDPVDDGGASTIDPDDSGAGGKSPEVVVITPEEEGAKAETNVDLSDIDYTPIDVSGYTKWDGKTKMQAGTNYYISGTIKPKKGFTVPEGSKLVITPGAQLTIFKGKSLKVKGSIVVEPKSTLTVSGNMVLYKGAAAEIYGKVKGTLSSVFRLQGEYIARSGSSCAFSGAVNIHKSGMYVNYGTTTLSKSAKMTVTGDLQTPKGGKLMNKGYLAVSISGRVSFAGGFYLYGETINSGVFVFEKTVRYYKAKGARFAVSKSSRLIDYRYHNNSGSGGSSGSDEATDTGRKGIDVSYAQGAIDWAEVKRSGIEFAILRASRGYISEKKPMAQDITFEYNVTQATAMGIDVGVYHYLYATTVDEAVKEARFFIETIKPYKITYPVVLDVEEQYQADLGKDKITAICKAFLDEVRDAGYYAMIYSNKAWLTNYLDMSKLSEYDVWLAQWNTVPTYTGPFGIWQYSSKGIVSGIDGYVDLNLSYKDYAKIIRKGGYNNLTSNVA